ncbi:MAG: DUF922 domain-containing protein [Halopseudomonas sp.]|uniref:DUF922 domain-containing protein n=1 Tax=Halopseudomonas sp. TaxID=2901191 RepID=UPI0030039B9C
MRLHRWFLLPALLGLSMPLLAEPALTTRVQQFDVQGNTLDTIRASLNRDRQHSASRVDWHFTWESTPGQCRLSSASTEVSVTSHMPRLLPDATRPASVQQQWDSYLLALQAHQDGHVELALDYARQIEQALLALPPQTSCEQLSQSANAAGQRLLNAMGSADREYDKRTQHGTLEGATFP